MGKILVIGYGNPMRGDDGLGPLAAQRLESIVQDEEVNIMVRHQMGIELAEDLKDADFAIFIDAHVGDKPGTLKEEAVVPDNSMPGSFSHHLRPGVLLSLVQALYNKHPEAVIYSIAAESLDHGEGLSPAVEATLPVLIDKVLARIDVLKAL
jgi:hydrogenase maturation protease